VLAVGISVYLVCNSDALFAWDGLTKLIGEEHIYDSLPDVLDAYREKKKQVDLGS
jgi:hypothetical protein